LVCNNEHLSNINTSKLRELKERRRFMKKIGKLLLLGATGLLLVASQAQAASTPFSFDPTGNAGADASKVLTVNTFDWLPSSALAVGAVPNSEGNTFSLYTFASLGAFTNTTNGDAIQGTGLGSDYQITFVAGFGETTTSLSPDKTVSQFSLDTSNNTPNFFEVYLNDDLTASKADNSLAGDNSAGTGFTAGVKILSGKITKSTGVFSVSFDNPVPLDSNGSDQYSVAEGKGQTVESVTGLGSNTTNINAHVGIDTIDSNYFLDGLDPNFLGFLLSFTTNLTVPFQQVDPANHIWNGTSYITADLGDGTSGYINGVTGKDFLFQVDANQSMRPVPEPTTMLLFGTGLIGLAGIGRRKRSKK
jgi:hypothetical protein